MSAESAAVEAMIQEARDDDSSLERLLASQRRWVRENADRQLPPRLGRRLDASDIAQDTMLAASQKFRSHFRGTTEAELLVWLGGLNRHYVNRAIRKHEEAKKRTIRKEERPGPNAALRTEDQTSPSQASAKRELNEQVQRLLDRLPPDQRTVLRLRYFESLTLEQAADVMCKSTTAVAGLQYRAVKTLRNWTSQ